jgi:hypothetical protein
MTTRDVIHEIRRATRPHGVAPDKKIELTARQKQRAYHNGILLRPFPGVYIDASTPRTPEQDLAAAVAAAGPMAAGWGDSSCAMWTLVDEHPNLPHVVTPRTHHGRIPGVVVHRSSAWSWKSMVTRNGILVTNPVLAAIDYGVTHDGMTVAEVLITARQKKLFEPDAFRAEVARRARSGRTGIRTARTALELVMIGDRPADSVLELRFHHGPGMQLPPYEYQWPVTLRGKDFRIDFAYPSVKVAIEVLGYDSRKSRHSLDYEVERSRLLVVEGWTVVPATWTHVVFDPQRVAADVLHCLGAAGYSFGRR